MTPMQLKFVMTGKNDTQSLFFSVEQNCCCFKYAF